MDTLPLVAPEQVGLSAQRLDRVRKWMHQWVDSGRLAGMVAVVMRKGELAFAETCGKADVERNKPMRPDTIFRFASHRSLRSARLSSSQRLRWARADGHERQAAVIDSDGTESNANTAPDSSTAD